MSPTFSVPGSSAVIHTYDEFFPAIVPKSFLLIIALLPVEPNTVMILRSGYSFFTDSNTLS